MNNNYLKYAMPLIVAGEKPSRKIINIFRDFYNIEGRKIYYIPQKKLFHYSVKNFIHDLSNSPWKTAFMRGCFDLPLPYYMIYRFLRK